MVTDGSMQADAFLFDELVAPGDPVVVERPSYDRTLLGLRQRGARIAAIPLAPDGIDVDALAERARGRAAPAARPHHPELPQPGRLHALARQARRGCSSSRASTRSRSSRTTPTSSCASAASASRRCSRWTPARATSCTRRRSPRPSARGSAPATSSAPELIARLVVRATNTYISPSMIDGAIVYEFCRSGALERSIETVRSALEERAGTLADALASRSPARPSSRPTAATSCGSASPRASTPAAALQRRGRAGVALVSGDDFVLDGASGAIRLAYSGVTPRGDPRGRLAARGRARRARGLAAERAQRP